MRVQVLEREQWLARPLPVVFDFFSRPENLGRITPGWLHFRIRSPLPTAMCAGARIDYTIRLAGVPVRWRTRIREWEPGRVFVDAQERGPYALWEHTHRFHEQPGGVLMSDRVRYALPLGRLGDLAHALAVRAALAAIFDFRFRRVRELLGDAAGSALGGQEPLSGGGPRPLAG